MKQEKKRQGRPKRRCIEGIKQGVHRIILPWKEFGELTQN